ncbi:Response regulator receiver domain-containing protein [Desulfacinum infernum DSM 9756]|uniref:Response regulator receiver domain-containing protein n=1 Tax=Desulfacinum infernum DSM 9756 TaxID=1121391 RepID=A0A1M4VKY7_9BACT|nr:response regulator [Desulfacinum infernum]SHE69669.1 Response regulator receiver domain-containing protein [Desulfacinum infernum DSM 9756]
MTGNKKGLILLVEDDPMDAELALNAFRETHLDNEVRVVETGEEALDYLLGRGDYADRTAHPLPDYILLDLKLPGLSGLEVLKILKTTPGIKRIPVIILTSSQEESDRALGYDYGVNSYLVKPLSFYGFLEVIQNLCAYWLTLNVPPPVPVAMEG